jgi:Zn-finger nucleic acid-binding protein
VIPWEGCRSIFSIIRNKVKSSMQETKQCEYCKKDININYMICPFCGGHLHETEKPLSPACPRCKAPLKVQLVNDEEYDICLKCGGIWLDRGQFHLVTREYDVYRKEDDKGEYYPEPLKDTVAYIPCVRCGKLMNRKNFAKISGVIIDECGMHGVWLDADEIDKIRHFIADGGLEKAQDAEMERIRTELKDLDMKVDQTALTQKLLHFWNLKRWLFGD